MRKRNVTIFCLLCASAAYAATITHVGTVTNNAGNEITEWRTPGTAKSVDADGDNVYGTAGRLFYMVLGQYPSYIIFGGSQTQVGPFGGYATVDHPDGSLPDIQVRTTTSSGAEDSVHNMCLFNVVSVVPPTFRVGIAFDGLDNVVFSPKEIRLTQTVGGSATDSVVVETFRNNTIDMVFFDVSGAQVGDQFSVQGVAGPEGYATHQFVTWDEVEPHLSRDGDVIAVDFSSAGGVAPGYNLFTAPGTRAVGSVFNTDGEPVTNVSITLSSSGPLLFNNDSAAAGWPGLVADPFYVDEADDIVFPNSVDPMTVTFNGLLSPPYRYTLRVYSLINHGGVDTLFTVTDGGTYREVINTRGDRWNAATLEAGQTVWRKLKADSNGELAVIVDPNGTDNTLLNAVVLEVDRGYGAYLSIR